MRRVAAVVLLATACQLPPGASVAGEAVIKVENWKPCATGPDYDTDVPSWAKSKALRPYYDDNIRRLAIHGLCNAKFRRVVVCDPEMDDLDPDGKNPAYAVCRKYFSQQK
ncbi:MAG: hypothetical protein ACR652_24800 [Methylocystis sp.]|uniref:hypothetical protein n=1 Tax=Methylocystis sp. TaxID=1911079 RepID=UPI003DA447F2